jgi:hypothetical protein
MHCRRRSPDRRLRSRPPKSVLYIYGRRTLETLERPRHFLLTRSPARVRRRPACFFPAAGSLAGGGERRRPAKSRSGHPPFLLLPPFLHQKTLKPQATERDGTHGARWRKAALLPAPSPARASTPWVSARPSSGPVVAPTAPVLDADVAAASICSYMPRTTACKPAQRRW